MTMYYTPMEEKSLEDLRKEHAVADLLHRPSESPEERDRVWNLLVLAAKN